MYIESIQSHNIYIICMNFDLLVYQYWYFPAQLSLHGSKLLLLYDHNVYIELPHYIICTVTYLLINTSVFPHNYPTTEVTSST